MEHVRSTLQEFLASSTAELLSSFESILEDFHEHLRSVEGTGLLKPVDICGKWYAADLLEEAIENFRNGVVTEIAYLPSGSGMLAFAIWRVGKPGPAGRTSDWADSLVGELVELYVAPGSRGNGIGRFLFRLAEEDSKRKGAKFFTVEVLSGNSSAVELYLSEGARPWTTTMAKAI